MKDYSEILQMLNLVIEKYLECDDIGRIMILFTLFSQTEPFGMLKKSVTKMSGNDRYEGFAVDIIDEIRKLLGFNYTYFVQEDNDYGSFNTTTQQWSGMMKRIIENVRGLHSVPLRFFLSI